MTDYQKLGYLADMFGYESVSDMLSIATTDGIAPAICQKEGCSFIDTMEPDQTAGWCKMCKANTVVSCLVIARICT